MKQQQHSQLLNSKAKDNDDDEDEPFEWDGVVVEGAHDAEFEGGATADDIFMPSAAFMNMANSVSSPALAASQGMGVNASGKSQAEVDFDPFKNAGKVHQMAMNKQENSDSGMNEDDLLEMGGDPAFLDDDVNAKDDTGMMSAEEMFDLEEMGGDPAFFGWDGTVDEDAHLD